MITPSDFVTQWNGFKAAEPALAEVDDFNLQTARPEDVENKAIPVATKQFFLEAGLPKSPAPLLSFNEVAVGLPRIWEVYSPHSWKEDEKQKLQQYFMIGSNDEDDPICVDESRDGQIYILAHDQHFQVWQFVNSSVMQLAEFLLAFNGPTPREQLESIFEGIDFPAIQENTFWRDALIRDT